LQQSIPSFHQDIYTDGIFWMDEHSISTVYDSIFVVDCWTVEESDCYNSGATTDIILDFNGVISYHFGLMNALLAQLVEQRTLNPQVEGSSPSWRTINIKGLR
jgi:hypothetical protein